MIQPKNDNSNINANEVVNLTMTFGFKNYKKEGDLHDLV